MKRLRQPWLHSAWLDGVFILSPPFLCLLAILLFPAFFQQHVSTIPVTAWVLLILLIDVGHVYSTLFRTYFEKETFQKHRQFLLWAPGGAWVVGVLLYSLGGNVFWRILAYLAVFHFVRQQYGFMRLYARKEQKPAWEQQLDTVAIYAFTLLPILYWHLEGNRQFNWFIDNDFIGLPFPRLASMVSLLNLGLFLGYVGKEIWSFTQTRKINLPLNLIMVGTFLAWYVGIVFYNGDLIFTSFNVISHGVPYLALVWIYSRKTKETNTPSAEKKKTLGWAALGSFLGLVMVLAYVEEGLWDSLVWREHAQVFPLFSGINQIKDNLLLSLLVPLLALPQITHYVVDGFIWKISKNQN
ncbi:hypothetical protein [Rufibacter sp. LB8]|uniref:hypothetical protein n=1 Tax=Rufibacter sp. LB8 TaxID=2777781 RepID=UPI00178C6E1F|nr:hypothetical protein [Rufibacter sp. LB8]